MCASRPTSSFSCGPAADSMALRTNSELPQVLKNACSAPTASAINFWACSRTPVEDRRSSSPEVATTSEENTAAPSTATTRLSAPRPCLCPGGLKGMSPRR